MKKSGEIQGYLTVIISAGALFVAILSFLISKNAKDLSVKSQQPDVRIHYTITSKLNLPGRLKDIITKSRIIHSEFFRLENEKNGSSNPDTWYLWLLLNNTGAGNALDLKIEKIEYRYEREMRTITDDMKSDEFVCSKMGTPPVKMHPDEVFAVLVQCFKPVNSQREKINPLEYLRNEMGFEGFVAKFYYYDVFSTEYELEGAKTALTPWPAEHIPIE